MNYIDISRRFWTHYRQERISAGATLLYYYLVDRWNTLRRPDQFELPTETIARELKINRNTVVRHRSELEKSGLLIFKNGINALHCAAFTFPPEQPPTPAPQPDTKCITPAPLPPIYSIREEKKKEKETNNKEMDWDTFLQSH